MSNYRTKLEQTKITDNLLHTLYLSADEDRVFLTVDYMNGKFMIEKSFTNNKMGLDELSIIKNQFNEEDKIRKYLKLGE